MAALKPVEKQVLTSANVAGTGATDCLENARQHSSSSASEKGRTGDRQGCCPGYFDPGMHWSFGIAAGLFSKLDEHPTMQQSHALLLVRRLLHSYVMQIALTLSTAKSDANPMTFFRVTDCKKWYHSFRLPSTQLHCHQAWDHSGNLSLANCPLQQTQSDCATAGSKPSLFCHQ